MSIYSVELLYYMSNQKKHKRTILTFVMDSSGDLISIERFVKDCCKATFTIRHESQCGDQYVMVHGTSLNPVWLVNVETAEIQSNF